MKKELFYYCDICGKMCENKEIKRIYGKDSSILLTTTCSPKCYMYWLEKSKKP